VVSFEGGELPQGLTVAFEPSGVAHEVIKNSLAGVPEWRVPDVVREADRFE